MLPPLWVVAARAVSYAALPSSALAATIVDVDFNDNCTGNLEDISNNGNPGYAATSGTATLTDGNWYRLSGTVLYDSNSKTFTFNDMVVADMGASGTSTATTIITGTGKTVVASAFDATGRVAFIANADRGFNVTDNYLVTAVPEPSAALLGALGLLLLLLRRR